MVTGHVLAKSESLDIVLQALSLIPVSCFTPIHTSFVRDVVISLLPPCSPGPASSKVPRSRGPRNSVRSPSSQAAAARVFRIQQPVVTRGKQQTQSQGGTSFHSLGSPRAASALPNIGGRSYCRIARSVVVYTWPIIGCLISSVSADKPSGPTVGSQTLPPTDAATQFPCGSSAASSVRSLPTEMSPVVFLVFGLLTFGRTIDGSAIQLPVIEGKHQHL